MNWRFRFAIENDCVLQARSLTSTRQTYRELNLLQLAAAASVELAEALYELRRYGDASKYYQLVRAATAERVFAPTRNADDQDFGRRRQRVVAAADERGNRVRAEAKCVGATRQIKFLG